ncbi:hypothetical protein WJU23_05210 [Prosthecobacter sp. SYSU 5D2]|uniref:hypothetical protein n=1 Tax=Prosthecobacter sp. SYSU 5D2 TaxID=3134134 RepID=UPI0031FE6757
MTQTDLANVALGHLGSSVIMAITENSAAAEHCRRFWDITRDALLRQRHWNFAIKRADLSELDDAPLFGWTKAYQLPADYILAIEFNGRQAGTGEALHEIEGSHLLTNEVTAELKYIRRHEDVSGWDASFCEAFGYFLAARIAPAMTSAQGVADTLLSRGEQFMLRAFGPDNLESRPRAVLAQTGSAWLAAREGANNW